jgi:protein YIPF5/7
MVPTRAIDISYLDDTDLAGPLVFALIFGFCLLCTGKVHFGYIYGFGAFGCLSMALVLNLLGDKPIDTWKTCSVLGYCLLPVVVLSAVGIVLDLRGLYGLVLSSAAVCWSCTAATKVNAVYTVLVICDTITHIKSDSKMHYSTFIQCS